MEKIYIKVHGSITNATSQLAEAATEILPSIVADASSYDEKIIDLDGSLLSIHFEGLYFMIDDFLAAISPHITQDMEGRIDYIDMDEWTMTRFWINKGMLSHNTADLNQVMDFSGH